MRSHLAFISQFIYVRVRVCVYRVCDKEENIPIFSNIKVDFEVENIINANHLCTARINLFVYNVFLKKPKVL